MTPSNPNLVDAVAAEYVLGTLRGPARKRFERWLADSALAQTRCRFWEEHLLQLTRGVRPVQPPAHVWASIQRRLNLPPSSHRGGTARMWALAASVVLVVGLATLIYWRSVTPGPLSEVATLAAPSGTAAWQIEVYARSGRLVVHTGQLPNHPSDRDFELWALPAGSKPVSLGVLPAGGTSERSLTSAQREALAQAQQIAVTIEPHGGSPTGQPTSTPILVAPLRIVS